jgi:membrane associated rhomboid family serine protease
MFIPLKDDNQLKRIPAQYVTIALIALSVVVYLAQLAASPRAEDELIYAMGLIPAVFTGTANLPADVDWLPAWATLVTSTVLHADFWHLLFNMLFLWVFGDNVEDALGHTRFLLFYLLCGVAAGLAHVASDPSGVAPMIGASGAISGVLGGYLMLHPRRRIWILLFYRIPLPVPAWLALGGWIGLQIVNAASAAPDDVVAWWAHIGGFIAGVILIVPLRHKSVPLFDRPPSTGPWSRP